MGSIVGWQSQSPEGLAVQHTQGQALADPVSGLLMRSPALPRPTMGDRANGTSFSIGVPKSLTKIANSAEGRGLRRHRP